MIAPWSTQHSKLKGFFIIKEKYKAFLIQYVWPNLTSQLFMFQTIKVFKEFYTDKINVFLQCPDGGTSF